MTPTLQRHPARPFTLVVGVDFSDLSHQGVSLALTLAGLAGGGEIHLVHVISLPELSEGLGQITHDVDTQLTEARERMERLVPAASVPRGAHITHHVKAGIPHAIVNEVARAVGADLVIVGTHGRDGLRRALYGSVAESVTRHAPCSVLTVRERELTAEEKIEPPCPECVKAAAADPAHPWCERHSRRSIRPHTYSELPEAFGGGSMSFRFPS